MFTLAQYEMLMGLVRAYRRGCLEPSADLTRLYLKMVDVLASYRMPEDVAHKFEIEVDAILDAAYYNRPVPDPVVSVVFSVADDGCTIIVECLRTTLVERILANVA